MAVKGHARQLDVVTFFFDNKIVSLEADDDVAFAVGYESVEQNFVDDDRFRECRVPDVEIFLLEVVRPPRRAPPSARLPLCRKPCWGPARASLFPSAGRRQKGPKERRTSMLEREAVGGS